MKKTLITIAALLAAVASYAQGQVNFTTKSGNTVNAPVLYQPATGAPVSADANFLGRLFWAPVNTTAWTAFGPAIPFRSDGGIGYITAGGTQTVVPGAGQTPLYSGDKVDILFQGYASQISAPAAMEGSGPGYNASVLKNLTLGGTAKEGPASPPALLAGLAGFTIPTVPEPSFAALGLLGAGLLLIRRKK